MLRSLKYSALAIGLIGATQAMAYPTPTARRGETFMLFGFPTGVQGNVTSAGTNELVIPNYKQTWGDIRKISDAPRNVAHLTFKSKEYQSASGHQRVAP